MANHLKRCAYYETCATYGLNVERVFKDGEFGSDVSRREIIHRFLGSVVLFVPRYSFDGLETLAYLMEWVKLCVPVWGAPRISVQRHIMDAFRVRIYNSEFR